MVASQRLAATTPDKLKGFPLFRQASAETLRDLAAATVLTTLAQGDHLWRVGDAPSHGYFLARGLIEITRATPDGEEVGLALFGPRECPGLFASLEGKKFPAGARCLSDDAEVLRVDRSALLHAVDRDSAVTRALGAVLQHHNAVLREKVEVLTAGEVPQRLATLFHLLAERFGDERETGELSIPLTLTRRVIARLVGVRVETVIRVLSRWEREGFVETSDEGFLVRDPARLRAEKLG